MATEREYEVVWRITVRAGSTTEAAKLAREVMIDPSVTEAQFEVTRVGDKTHSVKYVQDPDLSNL